MTRSPASAWGLLGSMIAIAWLGGGALPMAWGWLLPAIAAVVAALVARGRLAAGVPLGGWRLAVAARGPVLRAGLVLATGFAAVVFACALAGAVAVPSGGTVTSVISPQATAATGPSGGVRWALALASGALVGSAAGVVALVLSAPR